MVSIRRFINHFVGRVAVLAAATGFSALLSLALLPLATQRLGASDYGTYTLVMSFVILASSAMDGGASLILPGRHFLASEGERARILASTLAVANLAAVVASLFFVIAWVGWHEVFTNRILSTETVILASLLIPLRSSTNILIIAFSVTGRSGVIALLLSSQAALVFIGTVFAVFHYAMGGTSLIIGAFCGQIAALCVCAIVLMQTNGLALPSRRWLRLAMVTALTSGATNIVDGIRSVRAGPRKLHRAISGISA